MLYRGFFVFIWKFVAVSNFAVCNLTRLTSFDISIKMRMKRYGVKPTQIVYDKNVRSFFTLRKKEKSYDTQ